MAGNDKFDSIEATVKNVFPTYSDTGNAPQTEASIIHIDGGGEEESGIYSHDGDGYTLQVDADQINASTQDIVEDGAETGRENIRGLDHSPQTKGARRLGPTFNLVNSTTTIANLNYMEIGNETGPPYIPMAPTSVPVIYCYLNMTADSGSISVRINTRNRKNEWGLPPLFEITNQASDRGEVYAEIYADSYPMVTSARHDLGGSLFQTEAKVSDSGEIHPSSHIGIMYESL